MAQTTSRQIPDEAQVLGWMESLSNWGRWGDDDQLGTLNLISPEVVREAAGCIQHGRTIPLAVPLEHDGIQVGFIPGRDNPVRTMHAVNEGMDPDGDPDTFHTLSLIHI